MNEGFTWFNWSQHYQTLFVFGTPQVCNEVLVKRSFIGLSESELKKQLRAPRLSKHSLKSLPSILLPTEKDPSTSEAVYLFANPAQPHRVVELTGKISSIFSQQLLSPAKCTWEGQGSSVLSQHVEGQAAQIYVQDPIEKFMGGHLHSVQGWAEKHGPKLPAGKRPRASDFGGNDGLLDDGGSIAEESDEDGEAEEVTEVKGIAARELNIFESPNKKAKNLPAVPSFDGSPQPSGASASSGGRVARAGASSDGRLARADSAAFSSAASSGASRASDAGSDDEGTMAECDSQDESFIDSTGLDFS